MKLKVLDRTRSREVIMKMLQKALALYLSSWLLFAPGAINATQADQSAVQSAPQAVKQTPEELQQLVAPIALYNAAIETDDHLTSPGVPVGTAAYMSPEQVRTWRPAKASYCFLRKTIHTIVMPNVAMGTDRRVPEGTTGRKGGTTQKEEVNLQ